MKKITKTLFIVLVLVFSVVSLSKAQIGGGNTDITDYSFPEETGPATITNNIAIHQVDIEVAYGTDLTNLVATFTLSSGASADIGGTPQTSGSTVNDFSSGTLTYTVTNGSSSQDWDVNVTVASASSAKNITNFDLPNQVGNESIDTLQHTVDVTVAQGTDVSDLVADFTLSQYASATVNGVSQTSGSTHNDFTNPVTYTVMAQDSSTQDWTVTVTVSTSANTETEILDYSFPEQTGPATITSNLAQHKVDIEVEYGTDLSHLVATFSLSYGAYAEVSGVSQTSGSTVNDFSSGTLVYTITAEDSTTTQDWDINVTVGPASSAKNILNFDLPNQVGNETIDTINYTVDLDVQYGTNVSDLVADFTLSQYASATVNGVSQTSGSTHNDFTNPVIYTVMAQDSSTQDWTVTVNVLPNTETDILSYSFPEQTAPATINTNNHTVDIEVEYGTDVSQLVATFTLSSGASADIGGTLQTSGTTVNDFSSGSLVYTITADDGTTTQDWTVNVTVTPASTEKDILDFNLPNQASNETIDAVNHTVDVTLGQGTDASDLVADFVLSQYASATVNGVSQTSGSTHNDFTSPVIYTVTAQDGSTQDWTINVTVLTQANTEADIITYSFPEQTGAATIDNNNKTINIEVSDSADLSNLTATFTLSSGASVTVNGVAQVSGTTVNDFSSGSLIYTVTAEDGTTTQDWTVNVTKEVVAGLNNNNKTNIVVFPNPATDYIIVNNTKNINNILIIDVNGKIVKQTNVNGLSSGKINISELKTGLYFVKLISNDNYQVKKIIKN